MTIRYNVLNLPDIIQFKNGSQIRNKYDAGGQKLKSEYYTYNGTVIIPVGSISPDNLYINEESGDFDEGNGYSATDYVGNMEYVSNAAPTQIPTLDKVHNSEGYNQYSVSHGGYFIPYYFRKDHLGNNREVWCATTGQTVQRTQYYPSGLPWASKPGDNPDLQDKKYNGKEFVEMHGLDESDLGARGLHHAKLRFDGLDALCEKHYDTSGYVVCGNNPVNRIDPNGLDWFWYSKDGKADPTWNWRDENQYHTGVMDSNGKEVVLEGQEAVVTADGSTDEKVGNDGTMFGEGAKLANFTVYGPGGKDDIRKYRGMTMTSDFSKYGAIDNGEYNVNYKNPGKSGQIKSNWAVNNTDPVNCLFGENRNPDGYSNSQKNGVYLHSTLGDNGRVGSRTSTGCILIVPSGHGENGWDEFNAQLSNVSYFHFVLNRTGIIPPYESLKHYPLPSEKNLQYNAVWIWKH